MSHRISEEIQDLLKNAISNFEEKLTETDNYWEKLIEVPQLSNNLMEKLVELLLIDEGKCSDTVLTILENFDYFKARHPELTFPVRNLGRCRVRGFDNNDVHTDIPYYNVGTRTLRTWKYHEFIVIISDDDLLSGLPLLSKANIYDAEINKKRILSINGYLTSIVCKPIITSYYPSGQIPTYLIIAINHRHAELLENFDKWFRVPHRVIKYNI